LDVLFHHRFQRKSLLDSIPGGDRQTLAQGIVGEKISYGLTKALDILRGDQDAIFAGSNYLHAAADPGGDWGKTRGHSLKQGYGHPFGQRRENEDVRRGQKGGNILNLSSKFYASG
jgi:hypothetical protein